MYTQIYAFHGAGESSISCKAVWDAMNFLHSNAGFEQEHLVSGYDFVSLEPAVFVDIGEFRGHVSIAIARRYKNLRGMSKICQLTLQVGRLSFLKMLRTVHRLWLIIFR